MRADLLLIDERAGFRVAQGRGLRATGTLGVLDLAAERGLIDFAEAIRQLEPTGFRRRRRFLTSFWPSMKHGVRSPDHEILDVL